MTTTSLPKNYKAIHQISQRLKFNEISEDEVGVLLRLLVASKPGAIVLELGQVRVWDWLGSSRV
jgi:predicted O-methyltransferase YrrM